MSRHTSRRSLIESLENRQLLAAEIEPNNTFAQATPVPAAGTFVGNLSSATDIDYFRFFLGNGDRFRLDPFNFNAPLFSPTLPPGLEVFDENGNLLATSFDGSPLEFVNVNTGFVTLAVSSENAFGTFVGEYAMRSEEFNFNGARIPFQSATAPVPLITGTPLEDTFFQLNETRSFSFTLAPSETLVVSYAGTSARGPAAQIFDLANNVVASDLDGVGLAYRSENGGTFVLQLQSIAGVPGDSAIVLVTDILADTDVAAEAGDTLSDAFNWELDPPNGSNNYQQSIASTLETTSDIDVFRFEIDAFHYINFNLELNGNDDITRGGKTLTLYNQYGQFLARSNTGSLSTERPDAFAPGTYFIAVSANSPIGTGAYGLAANFVQDISPQRDGTTHFLDFDGTEPYLGFNRQNPYAVAEAIPYYVGSFDAKYSPYDVQVTRQSPPDGVERVAQGVGDFGDIGAGGFGSGSRGQRSSQGNAVTSALETATDRLGYYSTPTVYHEFGHAAGLPHARDVQAFMSYDGQSQLLPNGSIFSFDGTDSRTPGTAVNNHRNYLDFSLQAGAQVVLNEIGDARDNSLATSLDAPLREMSIDHTVSQTVDTVNRPLQIQSGDFNGDGRDDIVAITEQTGDMLVFLSDASGVLNAPLTIDVTTRFDFNTEPLTVADINGDGRDDVIVGLSQANQTRVYLAGIGGVLSAGATLATSGRVLATASADVDGDGDRDILVTTANGELLVFSNSGTGLFADGVSFTTVSQPRSITTGDYDADGDLDVFIGSNDNATVAIHRNLGTGIFTRAGSIEVGGNVNSVVAGNFAGNGIADLAVVSADGGVAEVYRSQGNGEFDLIFETPLSVQAQQVQSADVDGDGNADLLIGGRRFSSSVILGDGQGGFTRAIWVSGTTRDEVSLTAADLDGDGDQELVSADLFANQLTVSREVQDNPSNDKVVVFGSLDSELDVDRFTFNPAGEVRWDIDIDSAEFQMPVDAIVVVRNAAGDIIGRSDNATDRQSGITSVDPYVRLDFGNSFFIPPGLLTIEVTGKNGSLGNYRLKVTPNRAIESTAPRVIGLSPDNGATLDTTNQIQVLLDDIVDASSINSNTFRVTNAAGTRVNGTARVNPLTASIVWTAAAPLPVGTYTLTIDGVTDLNGNRIDGEIAPDFAFPDVSGNGSPGGTFISRFTITSTDSNPAAVQAVNYRRDAYQRGQFAISLTDSLSLESVRNASFTLRGAGEDGVLSTGDDTFASLDAVYDPIRATSNGPLFLYTRGVPDSGSYLIEGRVLDSAGLILDLAEQVLVTGVVTESMLFQDASLTQPGLVGSYVNQSLRGVTAFEDWRTTQTVAGSRVDDRIEFISFGSFGQRADVNLTGGSDANWENFSVQWDGFLRVRETGTQLLTRSKDGSRMFIDLDRNGVFGNLPEELVDNNWGSQQNPTRGNLSSQLIAGVYPVRIQFESTTGAEGIVLEQIIPGTAVDVDGFHHGPSVVATSIAPGEHVIGVNPDGSPQRINSFSVTFSGQIDTSTLTTDNLFLRRSDDAQFFDGDDEIIIDSDGLIEWDPTTLTATLSLSTPLASGFYIIEVNGEDGGVRNTAGQLLDGEFLTNNIPGNVDPAIWVQTPSGDGIPGGTYRSTFSFSPPRFRLDVADPVISEFGGSTQVTLTRLFADTSVSLNVALSSSDRTELQTQPLVIIPAGAESVTFTVNAIDDTILDGTQTATLFATAPNIETGSVDILVTDFEQLNLSLVASSISEQGGATELVLTRSDATRVQSVSISSNDATEALLPPGVSFAVGERTVRVPVTAVDDNILDGSQFVNITVAGMGLIDQSIVLEVTDFEALALQLDSSTVSENGGTLQGRLRRTDPNGPLLARVASDPADAFSNPITVQFQPGQTVSVPFILRAADNDLLDGTRSVTIVGSALGYQPATAPVTITDFEQLQFEFITPSLAPPVFDPETGTLVVPPPEISELDGEAVVRIRRTDTAGALSGTITVDPVGGLSFTAGFTFDDSESLSDPITISANDDNLLNGDRTFMLTASAGIYEDAVTELIVNDYEKLSTVLVREDGSIIADGSIPENSEPVFIRVTLPAPIPTPVDPALGTAVTIQITSNAPQFIIFPSSATMLPGDSFVDIPVQPFDNDIVGGLRNSSITVDSVGYISSTIDLQITEDDVPELTAELVLPTNQVGSSTNRVPERNGSATLVLTRNTIAETTVRLSTNLSNQFDWPELISFPRGFRRIEVPLTTIDNQSVDGLRDVALTATATGHPPVVVSVGVIDDEVAGLNLQNAVGQSIASGFTLSEDRDTNRPDAPATRSLSISLPAAPLSPVRFRVLPSSRLTTNVAELTFTPLNWSQPQTITVGTVDDQRTSGDETVQLRIDLDGGNSDPAFRTIQPIIIPVRIVEDDQASLTIMESETTTFATEFGLADQFELRLDTQPTAPVTLTFDKSELDSVNVSPTSLTFTPENWNVTQTVTVTTDDDYVADGHEIGLIFIDVSPESQAVGYDSIGRRRLSVIHVDTNLSELEVKVINDEVTLVAQQIRDDEVVELVLQRQPLVGGVFTTGSRDETFAIGSGMGYETLRLDASGGNDRIIVDETARIQIDGSTGYDVLQLDRDGLFFNPSLSISPNNPMAIFARNVEEIDTVTQRTSLADPNAGGDEAPPPTTQNIFLDPLGVIAITDERNELFVRVGSNDVLTLSSDWQLQAPVEIDNIPSHLLTANGATLRLVAGATWQNPINANDVDRSGQATALDALLVINRLNSQNDSALPEFINGEPLANDPLYYYDVNGDGAVTALDALTTINYLNSIDQTSTISSSVGGEPLGHSIVVSALPTTDLSAWQYDRSESLPAFDWIDVPTDPETMESLANERTERAAIAVIPVDEVFGSEGWDDEDEGQESGLADMLF
ncbi:FG-GAP-like repeat-containing protein [Neorhodopirellula pilleata]|uniref:FG-GAP-like repeat-containing protein n=1 Tax=Neorhodopirellula pilleata TaxID=2714738 RepID=UPI0018CF242E|nr:FG-GAP-like repeat-containing protein [Neorhodopirellula pilleata]